MKRLLIILLALMMGAVFPAQGEDYESYLLRPVYVTGTAVALNDREFLSTGWDEPDGRTDLPWHVSWWKDHQLYRDLPYYPGGSAAALNSAQFLVEKDGSFRVMIFTPIGIAAPGDSKPTRCDLFQWTEKGLTDPISISPLPGVAPPTGQWLQACGRWAVGQARPEGGENILYVFNMKGEQTFSWALPLDRDWRLQRFIELEDGAFLAEMYSIHNDYTRRSNPGVVLLCLDENGVRWQKSYPDYVGLRADGRGGAVISVNQKGSSYDPYSVVLVDRNGVEKAAKTISGNRVVVGLDSPQWNEEQKAYTFYGYAVANSRRYYSVYRLVTDERLQPLQWDVRALDRDWGDYSPGIIRSPQGGVFVITHKMTADGFTGDVALIPFDELPATGNPGLKLQ